jgi:hypothetical protein
VAVAAVVVVVVVAAPLPFLAGGAPSHDGVVGIVLSKVEPKRDKSG